MLQNLSLIQGSMLSAMDGEIGRILDFQFEAQSWTIRYVVAETGGWLGGRKVLLSPRSLAPGSLGPRLNGHGELQVNLWRKKIADSPPFESYHPITRLYEEEFHQHYGLPLYWCSPGLWRGADPGPAPSAEGAFALMQNMELADLRSTNAYRASSIHACDGIMGILSDFRVDSASWLIKELLLETGQWYFGKEIRVRTSDVDRLHWEASFVNVRLTRNDLRNTPSHHVAHAAPIPWTHRHTHKAGAFQNQGLIQEKPSKTHGAASAPPA